MLSDFPISHRCGLKPIVIALLILAAVGQPVLAEDVPKDYLNLTPESDGYSLGTGLSKAPRTK